MECDRKIDLRGSLAIRQFPIKSTSDFKGAHVSRPHQPASNRQQLWRILLLLFPICTHNLATFLLLPILLSKFSGLTRKSEPVTPQIRHIISLVSLSGSPRLTVTKLIPAIPLIRSGERQLLNLEDHHRWAAKHWPLFCWQRTLGSKQLHFRPKFAWSGCHPN